MSAHGVDQQLLDKIVRAANDAGKDGRRILRVEIIYGSATDTPHWVFIEDDGPQSAIESWR